MTVDPNRAATVNRWGRRLLLAASVVLGLWALAWLAVPPVVKSQAEQRLSSLLGRPVTIGRVSFAPWSLALTVEQLRIGAADAAAPPLFELARLHVDAELSSLFRLAPVVQAIDVDSPRLRLARLADGRYDIDDVLHKLRPTAPPPADASPPRFALYNLRLSDGQILFDDRPKQRQHRVDGLQLALPFLSNLPAHVEVRVGPRIAFRLDGAAFDSGLQAQPFTADRQGTLRLAIADLDLSNWLPYLPDTLPVRPLRGMFATDIAVEFASVGDGQPKVAVTGNASLADAAFAPGKRAEPALTWKRLSVELKDVQPLAARIALGRVRLEGASAVVRRDAGGRLDVLPGPGAVAPQAPSGPAAATSSGASAAAASPAAPPTWRVSVDQVELADLALDWQDATTRPATALRVDGVMFSAGPVHWPFADKAPAPSAAAVPPAPTSAVASASAPPAVAAPASAAVGGAAPFRIAGRLAPADAAASAASFTVAGQASDRAADVTLELGGLELRWLAPYLAQALDASVEARLGAAARLEWAAATPPRLALSGVSARLEGLRVRDAGAVPRAAPSLAAVSIAVTDTQVDLLARKLSLGSVRIDRPVLRATRNAQGQVNVLGWARHAAPPPAASASAASTASSAAAATTAMAAAPPAQAGPAWQVLLADAQLIGGDFAWTDERPSPSAQRPLRLQAGSVQASVRGLAWPSGLGTPAARTQLSMRVSDGDAGAARGATDVGRLEWTGQVSPAPLSARGTLRVERLPVHAVAPYVDGDMPIELLRAEASWRGDIAFAQRGDTVEASARGDARIGDLRLHERATTGASRDGGELLTWQSFALTGVDFRMQPGSKPQLAIGEAALADFYSRLVITEDGRFNLRDVAAAPKTDGAAPAPAVASATAAPASASSATATAPAGLPIDVRVGGVRLSNGKVDFTDRFIRPNYSAALTELNGRLGAFDSATRDMATLELRGRAAGTAQLEIVGSLNPTAQPLALDIQARATDLELAPFSPYAGRYAGYAIERGKLSMDVAYKIDADGKLDAKNQVVLNQLTFGDKVDSPDATKLPVLLAVALLKDRNGVIDINLPVSGSINDPQFSVFGIVLKIIGNLLVKALTAPFALLSGGGSEDLSFVGFEPGTARLTDAGRGVVDKVAKALTERPALKMTVTGASDPQSERDAIQRAALDARIAAEQRREALRAGAAADAPLPPLTPAQRDALVRRLYADTRLPDKPRNAIGLARDIPVPEMEALLRRATVVSSDTARELALQRGLAVRDALVAKGLPGERLFLAAPRLRASGEDDAAWSPRVQLALSTQ
jgi:uncharacterized protein involved in outer membrane biogenesis